MIENWFVKAKLEMTKLRSKNAVLCGVLIGFYLFEKHHCIIVMFSWLFELLVIRTLSSYCPSPDKNKLQVDLMFYKNKNK